jgi:hypothetical protein
MKSNTRVVPLLAAAALVLGACSSVPPRERMAGNLAEYQAAAGESVNSFWFPRLQSWEPLGEEYVLIRTGPRDMYLLTLEKPCNELPWASSIGLSSSTNRVHSKFDAVLVGDQRCRILQIQSVDRDALKQARAQDSGAT